MSNNSMLGRLRSMLRAGWRQRQAQGTAEHPQRREIIRDRFDPDRTDEAGQLMAALGGDIHVGDVIEAQTADPPFWQADEFTLSYELQAVGHAEIPDEAGQFSFTVALLATHQSADVLMLEGDQLQSAHAYLGAQGDKAIAAELGQFREDYLRHTAAEVSYEVQTDELGAWTAFSARQDGQFWLVEGQSALVPQSALAPTGTSYRDCSFYRGDSLDTAAWILRLVEIGGFPIVFQCEVLTLDQVHFWRHSSQSET